MKAWISLAGVALSALACVTVNKSILDRSCMGSPVPMDGVHVYLPGDQVPEDSRRRPVSTGA